MGLPVFFSPLPLPPSLPNGEKNKDDRRSTCLFGWAAFLSFLSLPSIYFNLSGNRRSASRHFLFFLFFFRAPLSGVFFSSSLSHPGPEQTSRRLVHFLFPPFLPGLPAFFLPFLTRTVERIDPALPLLLPPPFFFSPPFPSEELRRQS